MADTFRPSEQPGCDWAEPEYSLRRSLQRTYAVPGGADLPPEIAGAMWELLAQRHPLDGQDGARR